MTVFDGNHVTSSSRRTSPSLLPLGLHSPKQTRLRSGDKFGQCLLKTSQRETVYIHGTVTHTLRCSDCVEGEKVTARLENVHFGKRRWDMAVASTSTSTGPAMASDSELSRLGGIEALKLTVGPTRRNLFGPVDHQQLQKDFQRLLCMNMEVANKRWNFDFQRDTPGEGSGVEWVGLRCQDVPAFYHSCTVRPASRAAKATRRASTSSGEGSPMSCSFSGDEYLEVTTRGCFPIKLSGKRRQSNITDYFKVKKRKLLHSKVSSRQ
ncbi:uncharacterized protein LOC101160207 [Oryzias latipes]|uniref:Cyclin-dependent kinase inhibitor domain-containing protein n=2 Tax=Oryzias latipes TaxID=8090 RepID=H2M5T0_ORYLA|nr:uncharacterized protein LOC101160207 [Oryzias latipes]